MFSNPLMIILHPASQWQHFANRSEKEFKAIIPYLLLMAAIPSTAWYYGTTETGWSVGDGEIVKLTHESATYISMLLYVAMVLSTCVIGYIVHWMAETYDAESSVMKGIGLTALTATPFFVLGISGFYPVLWFDLLLLIIGICWSVYLLYQGIPIAMKIPQDQGFLYASALVAAGTIIMVCLLVATTILWSNGFQPVFAD